MRTLAAIIILTLGCASPMSIELVAPQHHVPALQPIGADTVGVGVNLACYLAPPDSVCGRNHPTVSRITRYTDEYKTRPCDARELCIWLDGLPGWMKLEATTTCSMGASASAQFLVMVVAE